MVSIWLGLRQIGMILGGAISLGYNVNGDSTGKIGYDTYYGKCYSNNNMKNAFFNELYQL